MCGIAGILSRNTSLITADVLRRMQSSLRHRGPDSNGIWINPDGDVGFAHQRLSILDTSSLGNQPLHYLDRYTIAYNGEIYNYRELSHFLQGKGYRFVSGSDTEIIPAALHYFGESFLEKITGMFSFALYDQVEDVVWFVRDRMGEKPFYFNQTSTAIYFGSEPAAIREAIASGPDYEMWLYFLATGLPVASGAPGRSFYSNIESLPPAHYMKVSMASFNMKTGAYWKPPEPGEELRLSDEEAKSRFLHLLTEAVEKTSVSDVATGNSLSGGTDSSTITALVKNRSAQYSNTTFSAVFPGFIYDEQNTIVKISEYLGVKSHMVNPETNISEELPEYLFRLDEPVAHSSSFAQFKVYETAARHGIKVLQDGQGADEILAGYGRYKQYYLQELWLTNKSRFRREKAAAGAEHWGARQMAARFLPGMAAALLEKKQQSSILNHSLIGKDFRNGYFSSDLIRKPVLSKLDDVLRYTAFDFGLQELLRYADRNSMLNGVEVRLPFLYTPLVEFCFRLPSVFKIRNGFGKWLLRASMNGMLPAEILWEKLKTGFETPHHKWMNNRTLRPLFREAEIFLKSEGIIEENLDPETDAMFAWRALQASILIRKSRS